MAIDVFMGTAHWRYSNPAGESGASQTSDGSGGEGAKVVASHLGFMRGAECASMRWRYRLKNGMIAALKRFN